MPHEVHEDIDRDDDREYRISKSLTITSATVKSLLGRELESGIRLRMNEKGFLASQCIPAVCEALKRASVRTLELEFAGIVDYWQLAETVEKLTTVLSLRIDGGILSAAFVAQMLGCPKLKRVRLAHCTLLVDGTEKLCEAIERLSDVSLAFAYVDFPKTVEGASATARISDRRLSAALAGDRSQPSMISRLVQRAGRLSALALSNCRIPDDAVDALARLLHQDDCNLKELDLQSSILTPKGRSVMEMSARCTPTLDAMFFDSKNILDNTMSELVLVPSTWFSDEREWSENEVVWAQSRGYPWWPGTIRVLPPDQCMAPNRKFEVMFFLSDHPGRFLNDEIVSYEDGVDLFSAQKMNLAQPHLLRNWRKALDEAIKAADPDRNPRSALGTLRRRAREEDEGYSDDGSLQARVSYPPSNPSYAAKPPRPPAHSEHEVHRPAKRSRTATDEESGGEAVVEDIVDGTDEEYVVEEEPEAVITPVDVEDEEFVPNSRTAARKKTPKSTAGRGRGRGRPPSGRRSVTRHIEAPTVKKGSSATAAGMPKRKRGRPRKNEELDLFGEEEDAVAESAAEGSEDTDNSFELYDKSSESGEEEEEEYKDALWKAQHYGDEEQPEDHSAPSSHSSLQHVNGFAPYRAATQRQPTRKQQPNHHHHHHPHKQRTVEDAFATRRIQLRALSEDRMGVKKVGLAVPPTLPQLLRLATNKFGVEVVEIWDANWNGINDVADILQGSGKAYFAVTREDLATF
mmetsp:Transcript_30580/g.51484  ORF Transcript_30580/g.51484 Transcript_30580/m.51484 type:complete len:745 (+) Transcript_30580:58-2292(+)|eukprot:CAMPEP_0184334266 /NCGR_PEP_ID=MMETSP1089-20130417/3120_1 /TAXON_ID=38269 ORGANISM="Gloeochaete wittrockiana, Strain SAG46.84" /NCGR_SAMPLE_ID=MMETSP1089 /ASSEMBLY_ACC=CAM_ASM_000445 /LENGTH=744 /DNA_ID=CAMNT_0026658487 /DNA_START=54 /DNA_END=2288 /DNA_ORIENTATION=+